MANKKTTTKTTTPVQEKENTKVEPQTEMNEVLSLLQAMRKENAKALESLKTENEKLKNEIEKMKKEHSDEEKVTTKTSEPAISREPEVTNSKTDKILEALVNRKMDREVTIVHNAEMLGGMSTYIKLSTMTIDFRKLGEQRVLSWQQFEELCNRYRKFIDRGLIKVTPEYRYLCDTYKIGCYDVDGKKTLTSDILNRLPDMSHEELEVCYNDLYDTDKNILLNYWMGQCYARPENRDKRFYDRYKVELLNRLSNSSVFDNILADMNFDEARR